MNILATSDIYSVRRFGGGTRHLFGGCTGLARRGHRVDMLLPCPQDEDILKNRFPELNFILYPVSGAPGMLGLSTALNSRAAFLDAAKRTRYDIVQLNQPKTALGPMFLCGGGAGDRRARAVYHFLSPWPSEYEAKSGGRRGAAWRARLEIERALLRRCSGILVLSEYMKGELLHIHPEMSSRLIRVVPGGVEVERFRPAADRAALRDSIGFPKDRFVLFTARFFTPRTGVGSLIAAMPAVAKRFPEVFLVISGHGPMKPALEAQAAELKLGDHVRFVDFIEDEKFPDYYRAADLFVLPTRELEGFGLVTVESLACGTPVVGTPVGATPEILRPLNHELLMRDASPEAIAERIVFWMERRGGLPELGHAARKYALDNFSWEHVAEKIENLYEEVAGKNNR